MYWTGDPDYWKLTDTNKRSDYPVSYYPLSFKNRLYQEHYKDFDEQGLPMFPSKTGKLVHFCTGMCSFAFAHWEEFLDTGKAGTCRSCNKSGRLPGWNGRRKR